MSASPMDRLSPIVLGATLSHAERARTLVAQQRQGALCTLLAPHARAAQARSHDEAPIAAAPEAEFVSADPLAGFPYGSVVTYAADAEGVPLLLTSSLAEHTRNFLVDARASLLVQEASAGSNPLALGRVTLLGRMVPVEAAEARTCYLEQHPDAAYHVDFKDFSFFKLRVEAIRYIGGFGRMSWLCTDAYARAEADPTASFAPSAVEHMNQEHTESLLLLCQHLAGLVEAQEVALRAVDRLGFEMMAQTPCGPRFVRLGFPSAVRTPDQMRAAFVSMVASVRARLGG